jgi:hypothetical protein
MSRLNVFYELDVASYGSIAHPYRERKGQRVSRNLAKRTQTDALVALFPTK